jgi:hypothetical protein
MQIESLATLEYEALRTEERDRMNARLQVWAVFASLVSLFGVLGLQSGMSGYVLAVFPLLCLCLAFHIRHSEEVLRQIRKYIYQIEKGSGYEGYEHFTRTHVRALHGGYLVALCYALVMAQLLAIGLLGVRCWLDHVPGAAIVLVVLFELVIAGATWYHLRR